MARNSPESAGGLSHPARDRSAGCHSHDDWVTLLCQVGKPPRATRADLTSHVRAVHHPATEEQTVTRRFYLERAPRPSPGRAKDRRSRPEHDRSPRDRGRVAPPRGSRRRAGAFGPPNPRSARRAHASRRSVSLSHRLRQASVASPRSRRCPAATVARGLDRSGGVQARRRHTRVAPSSTLAISRRRSVASAESTISRRSRALRTSVPRTARTDC